MTTTPTQAVTITLPGPPVAYAVEPVRLVAWLEGRGYALAPSRPDEPTWLAYMNQERRVLVLPNPSEWEADEYAIALAESVGEAAEIAGIGARDLAALLSTPAEGPALQWAHASADTRAPVLALLDREARRERSDAVRCRNNDEPELALAAEGRAMAHEAAAAVLRASSHG